MLLRNETRLVRQEQEQVFDGRDKNDVVDDSI